MTRQHTGLALGATLAAALSVAEESAPTRNEYDAFMAAFVMEQHRAACERYAPSVYPRFAQQVEAWRNANEAAMRRLEPAARRWQLPGKASVDELLANIAASMDADYAAGKGELTDTRCKRLLDRIAASNNALERAREG